ncbi:MAG: TetR/AcrR family transcriptional regulator [Amycolatopsis sp.]|jgi:AcrR family transcriptional regulator|uniref:TetR/AcrR family transcriptional regulator n=1 Tax=Amycolatopsis sp. TaxID=37632 RepID=UPI0026121E48|nr:TetR/AcrR family transcriptional regulator [Amycolatopsis sp.]MCU1682614.1 TetR/AcrR family transcriptional regulator [Amycolatopsis sp.]
MRTRLSTEQRREQLLTIGAGLFANRPYDEVWIEEVAEIAEVSRGLLYHYFPTKRDFFAEIVRAERDRLLRLSAPDKSVSHVDQLTIGLDVYLDYAQHHPDGYRVIHRAAAAGDAEIREIRDAGQAANRERILAGLADLATVDATTKLAVRGWFTFVTAITLDWLDNPAVTREDLRDLCVRTLFAAVGITPPD